MPVKLTSTQYKIIAATILLAAVSLAVSVKYFEKAFPEASITFRVNRTQSQAIAARFVADRRFDLAGYQHAAVFNYDDDTKLYLERTQGLERMNQLARGPIHLWRWDHRWFKSGQKEEFRVSVTPGGDVVGFDHEIPEAAPGAHLDQNAARQIAEGFLTGVMKRDLNVLEFMEATSRQRPARTDHSFTWKQKDVNLGDGSLRIEVEVDGDRVAGYEEFVKIPDQWIRDYQRLRSRNVSAQVVDQVLWALLSVAMLVLLVMRLRDGDVPWRLAATFGAVAATLYFLGQLNTFSLAKFEYSTTDPYASFLANYLVRSILSAVGIGVAIFLLIASSEPVYREAFPRLLSLRRALTWPGLRSRSFFMANVVGIGLTFFFFAYQTIFYLAANRLGAWAPSDIPFSNDLNTTIPWVAVLFTGFFPAVSEEMQFRAFAIPFLKKVFRYWPVAIVLAAFNWGFLHSAYPNQPFFIRGVEVGIGGMIIGLIMMRFGIVATMIWHYSVDALYQAFLLLRSPNHYLMLSGAVTAGIMLIPLGVALVAYLRTGTFTAEEPLTNQSEGIRRIPKTEVAAAKDEMPPYRPLSGRALVAALGLIVLFGALAAIPVYRFGQEIKLRVTRRDALRLADDFLRAKHVAPETYRRVATLQNHVDPLTLKYLLEYRSVREADAVYRQATKLVLWEVRYFRPLQIEEYLVFIDPETSRVFAYRHILDENAPGSSLSSQQAQALAERFLAEQGYDLHNFTLQDSEARKRKAREDYELVWQAKPGDPRNVGEAYYRLQVEVAGDQIVGFVRLFKLPETWVRHEQQSSLVNVLLHALKGILYAGLVAAFVGLFVRQVRRGALPWKRAVRVAIPMFAAIVLYAVLQAPLLYQFYSTSIPLSTFKLLVAAGFLTLGIGVTVLIWLLVAFATSLYPQSWSIFLPAARRTWRRDALVALVVSLVVGAGLDKLTALLYSHFHAYAAMKAELVPGVLNAWWPGAAVFLDALPHAVAYAAIAAFLIYLVRFGFATRAWWLWLGVALLVATLGPTGAHSAAEYFLGWADALLQLAATIALVIFYFRDNVLAYVAAAFCLTLAEPLVYLLSQSASFFRWNGISLALLTALVLWWFFVPRGAAAARPDDSPRP
jgi:membrane protease YdiL (CAAX protease family)